MGKRAVPFEPLEMPPGIFTEETNAGAVRRWKIGDNARWDSSQPQKVGGFIRRLLSDIDGLDAEYMGKARAYHEWESLDGQSWIAFGTACKLYLISADVLYDITPLRRQVYLVGAITTQNGSSIVTVNDPLNDAQEGDHFTVSGGTAVGGITIPAGEYDVASVIDPNNFTFDTGIVATSSTTGGGTMTFRYDISCGLESDGFLYGYGVGDYGEETYGTPRSSSTYRGYARIWSLDNWGEDLMASPNGDTLYIWKHNTGPQSKAEAVVGAPANIEHMLVGPDNLHVIALGANLASTGVQDRMFVRWNAQNDYNDWVATSTNDAGSKRLDVGSRLITGVKTNRQILLYTDKAVYVVSFIGGSDVYDIVLAGRAPVIMSPNSAVDVDGTVYSMMEDDFYIFDGTLRVLDCDVKSYVFGDAENVGLNFDQRSKVTVRLVREFNEIWWSYPRGSETENSAAVIYNYYRKCWYLSSIPREIGGDVTSYYRKPVALYDGKLWIHETGVDGGTETDADTLLLMHMDGANSGTLFPDSSSYVWPTPVTGSMQTKTASPAPLFGTASAANNGGGSGTYVQITATNALWNFSTTDWTIEFGMFIPTTIGSNVAAIVSKTNSDSRYPYNITYMGAGGIVRIDGADQLGNTLYSLSTGTPVHNAWNRYAFQRRGNIFECFMNGVLQASATVVGAVLAQRSDFPVRITPPSSDSIDMNLDEVRFSRVARYLPAGYTPATSAFTTDAPVALVAYLETWEQQFGAGDFLREIVELVPDIKRMQGSFDVTLFGRNFPQEARVDGPVRTFTVATTKVNPRFRKRQMGLRIESSAVGDDWRIGTWRGKYLPHGRR
jgi:hypothetical protein